MAVQDLNTIAFPTLSEEQIARLGRYAGAVPKKFRAGEALFRTGDRDFKFFVVRSGEIEILDQTGETPKTIAIHSRGETRRSGAYNREVVHRALESLVDADGIGEIPVRRVAKHVLRTDDDRRFGFGDAEVLEELIDVRIGFEIGPGEEHQVLGQEVADAERVG